MKPLIKKILFFAVGGAIVMSGVLILRAANNKGSSPLIYLKMDEGYASTTYDATGNGYNASLQGNATWADEAECVSGRCVYLDGTGDYISIPDFSLE